MDEEFDSFPVEVRKSEKVILVPPYYLRELFNRSGYLEKVQAGAYSVSLHRNSRSSPNNPDLPEGTYSQMLHYFDEQGRKVAVVHQYLLPDGSLGGSGRPDPKYLRFKGRTFSCERGGKPVAPAEE